MPTVKNVGEPCAGKSHARFDAAAGGNQASRASIGRAAQAPLADPNATATALRALQAALSVSLVGCGERPELPTEQGRRTRPAFLTTQGGPRRAVMDAQLARCETDVVYGADTDRKSTRLNS